MLGLAAGFGIQSLGRRIDNPDGVRGVAAALTVLAIGMALAALAAHMLTIWMSLIAATVLGCGYGMAMISGLLEVQRIAAQTSANTGRNDLAGLTAVFYSVTYLGFAIPAVLAVITEFWHAVTYTHMFIFGIVAALLCLAVAMYGHRRHTAAV